jgi:hypothetical protein
MALTEFQRTLCRLISRHRIELGESYVAGGVALSALIRSARISRDIDLFHDTREAVQKAWDADRALLLSSGYKVDVRRERPAFVEAVVSKARGSVLLEWAVDSAFRFFPLVQHPELGLALHPFDLATNKVLALVGRLEVRDWIDVMECHLKVQKLGYLVWAACGKDPGLSPAMILAESRRSAHYTEEEVAQLAFSGRPPKAKRLAEKWRAMTQEASSLIRLLPPEHAGKCVLHQDGDLFQGGFKELKAALLRGKTFFHAGSLRGAFPRIVQAKGT